MPTGFTVELVDKNLNFKQFALLCSRAFGLFIHMRDEPLDAPIPEKIEPISTYHKDSIEKCQKELNELLALTTKKQQREWARNELGECIKRVKGYLAKEKNKDVISKYKKMLKKVEKWKPPTEEHKKLKEFMEDQLKNSIRFDAPSGYWIDEIKKLRESMKHPLEFYEEKINKLKKDIEYHTARWNEDVKSAEKATQWIQQLRDSIKESA